MLNDYKTIVIDWLLTSGIRIAVVLIAAYILHLLAVKYIDKLVRRAIVTDPNLSKDAEKKREVTLIKIIHRTFHVLLIVVAGMMVMSNLGLNVGPLLAAAGIAGLALGFGGQYLIKDVISGLFIILENQYRIADVVCIGGKCGLVEDITLRMTTLRDLDGTVHHVPHGEIKAVSNLSKHYSRVNLNVRISYSSSLEKVISVVNRVGEELANDPDWKEHIIKPPQFLRVDDFADSAIVIKILGDTKPIKQWDVTGELRKRLKIAFDKEGIEIPLPQRVVHYASE